MKIWPRKAWPEKTQASRDEDERLSPMVDDLARLYRPKEMPAHMRTEFEEAKLRHSMAVQRRPRLTLGRSLQPTSRIALAGGLAILVGVAAAAAGLTLPGGGKSRSVAEAVQFLQSIPPAPSVQEGEVIHQKVEQYFRYGPHSEVLGQRSGVPTESRIVESWQEVGPNNAIIRSYARTVDATGLLVQEDILKPGEWRTIDPRTGRVIHDLPYQTLPVGNKKTAEKVERELAEGRQRVVSQTDSELVLEYKDVLPPELLARPREQLNNPMVGHVGDLDPRAIVTRGTFRNDGILVATEQYAETGSGERVLITSSRTVVWEILDEMPVDIP
jgi:hypothetical protein